MKIPFQIPKTFQLGGRDYVIQYKSDLADERGLCGEQNERLCSLVMQKMVEGRPQAKDHQDYVYLHEAVHAILDVMQEDDLNKNEKFVGLFAELLFQMLKTSEYEDKLKPTYMGEEIK